MLQAAIIRELHAKLQFSEVGLAEEREAREQAEAVSRRNESAGAAQREAAGAAQLAELETRLRSELGTEVADVRQLFVEQVERLQTESDIVRDLQERLNDEKIRSEERAAMIQDAAALHSKLTEFNADAVAKLNDELAELRQVSHGLQLQSLWLIPTAAVS